MMMRLIKKFQHNINENKQNKEDVSASDEVIFSASDESLSLEFDDAA